MRNPHRKRCWILDSLNRYTLVSDIIDLCGSLVELNLFSNRGFKIWPSVSQNWLSQDARLAAFSSQRVAIYRFCILVRLSSLLSASPNTFNQSFHTSYFRWFYNQAEFKFRTPTGAVPTVLGAAPVDLSKSFIRKAADVPASFSCFRLRLTDHWRLRFDLTRTRLRSLSLPLRLT